MKHLDLCFYRLWDVVDDDLFDVLHILGTQPPADGLTLTKALGGLCSAIAPMLNTCSQLLPLVVSLIIF
jgi:hypothetical protein